MATKNEMAKVRMVLDYIPCESCRDIPLKDQKYLCTVCHRLSRTVTTDQQVPQWKIEHGVLTSTDDTSMDDLKPTVIVYEHEPEIIDKTPAAPPTERKEDTGALNISEEKEVSGLEPEVEEPPESVPTNLSEEFEILEIKEAEKKKSELPVFEPEEEPLPEWSPVTETTDDPFKIGDYTLYTKMVILRGNRQQRIYFFSKEKKKDAAAIKKPKGYKIVINKRTGLPLLKKKKRFSAFKSKNN